MCLKWRFFDTRLPPSPFQGVGPRSLKPQTEKNQNKAHGGVGGRSSQVLFTKSGYCVEK